MDEKEAQEVEIREEVKKNEEKPVKDKGKFLARLKEKRAKKKCAFKSTLFAVRRRSCPPACLGSC